MGMLGEGDKENRKEDWIKERNERCRGCKKRRGRRKEGYTSKGRK